MKRIELRSVLPQGVSNSQLRKGLVELGLPTDEGFDFSAEQVQQIQGYFASSSKVQPRAAITQSEQPQSVEDAGSQLATAVNTQNELARKVVTTASRTGSNVAVKAGTEFLRGYAATSAVVWTEIGNAIDSVQDAILDPSGFDVEDRSPEEIAGFFGQSLLKGFSGNSGTVGIPETAQPAAAPGIKLAEFSRQTSGPNGLTKSA